MNTIFIEKGLLEYRLMILEGHRLCNYQIVGNETPMVGDIFKGRVEAILPEIDAAFIDVGLGKNAFLRMDDIPEDMSLKRGQILQVQVLKEAIGDKGPRVSMYSEIRDLKMVLINNGTGRINISKKISDTKTREKLKEKMQKYDIDGYDIILRTGVDECTDDEFDGQIEFLKNEFSRINENMTKGYEPCLIRRSKEYFWDIIKNYESEKIESILIEDRELYDEFCRWNLRINYCNPQLIKYYEGQEFLSSRYAINQQIDELLDVNVALKNGGELVIEKTEAMTVIDVNTKSQIKTNKSDNKLKFEVNEEAAVESIRQIILRNLSGMILIDFMKMSDSEKNKLSKLIKSELKKDCLRSNFWGFTKLGLAEISRQRNYNPLEKQYKMRCAACQRESSHHSIRRLMIGIENEYRKYFKSTNTSCILLRMAPKYEKCKVELNRIICDIEKKYDIKTELVFDFDEIKPYFQVKTKKFAKKY